LLLDILLGMEIYNTETCDCGIQMLQMYFSLTEGERFSSDSTDDHLIALEPVLNKITSVVFTKLELTQENGIHIVSKTELQVKSKQFDKLKLFFKKEGKS